MPQIGPYAPNNAAQGAQGLIGPYSPGGGGGQSLIAQPPFSIDQLLDIVRRTTPPGFWQPLFAGNGLAGWNAIAAVLARVSLAVYNADQQSYILSATVGTPAVGSVTVTAIGVVPVTVPIPTGTIINYQPGSGAGLSYFVTTAPATLSAGTNTIVTLSVVSVVDGSTVSTAITLRAPTRPRVAAMMPSVAVRNGIVRNAVRPKNVISSWLDAAPRTTSRAVSTVTPATRSEGRSTCPDSSIA